MDDKILHESLKVLDNDAKLEIFASHWKQILSIVEKCKISYQTSIQNGSPSQIEIWAIDDLEAVQHYFDQLLTLLMDESAPEDDSTETRPRGLLLNYAIEEDIFEHFFTYFDHPSKFIDDLRTYQLNVYERLASCSFHLIAHKRLVHPMMRLLSACSRLPSVHIEKCLVNLLHRVAANLDSRPNLLNLFWNPDHGSPKHDDKFLIFTLLVPFIHRDGEIGYKSREAILSLLRLSLSNYVLGHFISSDSDFCPVVATGLSGLYSSLPRKLILLHGDWCRLSSSQCSQINDLNLFINSLQFCNAVAMVAHPLICGQLTTLLYNGFLVPVMGPALHQNSIDEVIAATAYLELCFRKLSNEDLLCTFLKFTLTDKFDEIVILESLINRIVHNHSKLAAVSLALFDTIIDLCVEDVMQQLIFKYLTPCSHVMRSQRSSVRDVDLYSRGANKFLQLVPSSCQLFTTRDSNSSISSPVDYGAHPPFSYSSYLNDARTMIDYYSSFTSGWSSRYNGLLNDELDDTGGGAGVNEIVEDDDCFDCELNGMVGEEIGEFLQELRKVDSPPPEMEETDVADIMTELDALYDQVMSAVATTTASPTPVSFVAFSFPGVSSQSQSDYGHSMGQYSLGTSGLNDVISDQDSDENGKPTAPSSPDIGPFLTSLLNKLDNMLANSLSVNLLLTGLIAKLSCFPQPLLRSFLVSSTLVFQPSVKSLSQVLNCVRQKIDRYAETVPNFARLLIKGNELLKHRTEPGSIIAPETTPSPPPSIRSANANVNKGKRNLFSRLFGPRQATTIKAKGKQLQQLPDGSYVYINRDHALNQPSGFDNPKTQNAVFSTIIFYEFLKELAAICQEHSVSMQSHLGQPPRT